MKAKDYGFKAFQKMPESQNKHFSKFHESMFESPAWIGLSIHSRYLYIEMTRKFTGRNEQDIMFTQKEGIKIMGKNTFTACIKQLIQYGFIEYVERNSYNCLPNIYGFSTKWHLFIPEKKSKKKLD
ncbi:hypothetical protein [Paenibacillus sp. FSL H8-0034]|uniref:hypothetical protein n=1 Tax=Paenibacillus sp. FSL H8-0034 TaxID=2954671 RepID=UPI0030F7242E